MVRMGKEIGRELVVVPYETGLDIVLHGMDRNLRKLLVHHITVKCPYSSIDAKHFKGSKPRTLFGRWDKE